VIALLVVGILLVFALLAFLTWGPLHEERKRRNERRQRWQRSGHQSSSSMTDRKEP